MAIRCEAKNGHKQNFLSLSFPIYATSKFNLEGHGGKESSPKGLL
jgi:hypothetical protein